MLRFLRRTFSRRDRNRPQQNVKPVRPASQHIPAPPKCRDIIPCHVVLLDGSDITVDVPRPEKGEYLFRKIVMQLDLVEEDYFGLQFMDKNQVPHWLDKTKKIKKQIQGPPTFHFRVKFYTSEPINLGEELTRYQFFLQLKQDILQGKMPCPGEKAIKLAALALQSELGAYEADVHNLYFISEFRFVPDQNEDFEVAVLEEYKALSPDLNPAAAEKKYLEEAMFLEHYGVDMHSVKSKKDGNDYRLGLTPSGILVLESDAKIGLFFWPNIKKLEFKERKLILVVTSQDDDGQSEQEHKFVFVLDNAKACKHLWKCAVEHHTFFRLQNPIATKHKNKQFIRMGSRFRPSFRTEMQLQRGAKQRMSVPFERKPSRRYSRRSTFRSTRSVPQKQVSGGDANDHFRRFIPAEGPSAPPDLKYKPISGFGAGRKPPKREESGSTVESRGRSDSPKGWENGDHNSNERPVLFMARL